MTKTTNKVKKAPSKKSLQLIERLKKDNAAYKAMSPIERRVVVAKEIRTMLKKGTFVAGYGYGETKKINNKPSRNFLLELSDGYTADFPLGDLQPIIRAGGFECMGCAKAAVIVARAAVGNEVRISPKSFDDEGGAKPLADKVSKEVFGAQCADLIESLYEGWAYDVDFWEYKFKSKDPFKDNKEKINVFNEYVKSLSSESYFKESRMDAIFENIVKNKGYLVIGEYKF